VSPRATLSGVAVFDLDGTITRHDTMPRFLLLAVRRRPARAWGLWIVPGALARFLLDRDRGRLKSRLVRALLGGATRTEVARLAAEFATGAAAPALRSRALAAIGRHRARGDYLVLLSASVDLYVPALGARLGFDEVICTELLWRDDRLDGALRSANRRGDEKTRCLEALRGEHPGARITAYGNADSDLEHLARADAGWVVNGSAGTRRAAARLALGVDDWD
jgi:phosphatidylglycerophosphatase C